MARLSARASATGRTLRLLANGKRLMALCHLAPGERSVGELAALVGLSQSALSQHLARLRAAGMVAVRREARTAHYRLADPAVAQLIRFLYRLYCRPAPKQRKS
ncbi:MAG: helix-turn-helix transcriptional regulator [Alphaproteobacteria bacterium]|nr:helix-turn-helix transcriptional regulator [Alphaproteobacteria bacterium]